MRDNGVSRINASGGRAVMKRMSPLDASWLLVESEDTPMQVGSLQIFSLPENAEDTFLRDMVARMKSVRDIASPWYNKLYRPGPIKSLTPPFWKVDKELDLDYHVRHSALPKPGGERELGVLISRLHSNPLDFSRPLWECHIIEGLENNRFALYCKMHHSMIDGISGMRLLQRLLSTDPEEDHMLPPWAVRPQKVKPGRGGETPTSGRGVMQQALDAVREQAGITPTLTKAFSSLLQAAGDDHDALTPPFAAPQSMINRRITGQRRFATQQYSLERLIELAHTADASLNDIVLYLCGSSLRRFLLEENELPDKPLTAGIPVNIRPADDEETGTAISFMIASLATDEADPLRRLDAIKASTTRAKHHLQSLPRSALTQYTLLLMAPYVMQLVSGLGGRMRPAFNVTISNVPGPKEPLYYNRARMEAMYPVSLITHGGALNITCLSYAGSLNFGYTGCRDTLPSMQRLAVYTGEALEELDGLLAQD
jgi:diacylglycerol O-acyltransferase